MDKPEIGARREDVGFEVIRINAKRAGVMGSAARRVRSPAQAGKASFLARLRPSDRNGHDHQTDGFAPMQPVPGVFARMQKRTPPLEGAA